MTRSAPLLALVPALSLSLTACGPGPVGEAQDPSHATPAGPLASTTTRTSGTDQPAATGSGSTGRGGGSGSTHGSTGATPSAWPIVPDNGGAVIAAPQLVLITFDGDPNRTALEADATWLMTGEYLPLVGADYGIGKGGLTTVHLGDEPPGADGIEGFLLAKMQDGTLPAPDPSQVYAVVIPHTAESTPAYCARDQGFHSYFVDGQGHSPVYAVVLDCQSDLTQVEVTLSHELVEASANPLLQTYQIQDPQNPWTYLDGEIGDLCASNTTYAHDPSGQFSAALIWSNSAAAAGGVPCIPWPSSRPYLSLVASQRVVQPVAPGGQVVFTLTGWASVPGAGTLQVLAAGDALADFATSPTLSATSIAVGGQLTVTLTVPADAAPGQHGAAWIGAADPVTGEILGSTMVAVESLP